MSDDRPPSHEVFWERFQQLRRRVEEIEKTHQYIKLAITGIIIAAIASAIGLSP